MSVLELVLVGSNRVWASLEKWDRLLSLNMIKQLMEGSL